MYVERGCDVAVPGASFETRGALEADTSRREDSSLCGAAEALNERAVTIGATAFVAGEA